MTREQAKELLPIIKAFSEGKPVQFMSTMEGKWTDVSDRLFTQVGPAYRIKPEPREFCLALYEDGVFRGRLGATEKETKSDWVSAQEYIRVKEVL